MLVKGLILWDSAFENTNYSLWGPLFWLPKTQMHGVNFGFSTIKALNQSLLVLERSRRKTYHNKEDTETGKILPVWDIIINIQDANVI